MATWIFLILALAFAFGFEFVNGFHDTANAVATVIYTHSLKPNVAVIWSGLCNLTGVLLAGTAVAYSIVSLLPVELVIHVGSASGFAMVFALLISAITWNLGTWYLGLPASSSHTLIGSIMGVGLAHSWLSGHSFGEGVNWHKAQEVGMTLLLSPVVGFIGSALLLVILKALVKNPALFTEPDKDKAPPLWIRSILIATCTLVSFGHGSNDGQKGMGLIVLILVGILPGTYALNLATKADDVHAIVQHAQTASAVFAKHAADKTLDESGALDELSGFVKPDGVMSDKTFAALKASTDAIGQKLGAVQNLSDLSDPDRRGIRTDIYLVGTALKKILKGSALGGDAKQTEDYAKELNAVTQYVPDWVKFAVALSLGLGTTVGWKRIVVTVGEKIGKSHLTYGQGASAELIAATTILLADKLGMPVSTTHVLSSGVAGTMAANGSGLQAQTLRNILLAWVLTLPVCIILGSALFAFGNYIILHVLGLKG